MTDAVLTLNAGSSSIKFALFERASPLRCVFRGQVERIGSAPRMIAHDGGGGVLAERKWDQADTSYEACLAEIVRFSRAHLGGDRLRAVGHRVVHGGATHSGPARVTPALLDELETFSPLAPLHQPHNLAPIRAILAAESDLPQSASFDTAFHHGMPEVAHSFPLTRKLRDEGVRRYGFHGLSYAYIARRLAEIEPALAKGRVVVAHLGNGASLCGMRDGRSLDTTMGFTALDGLMMGTRCGAIDPGVLLYLMQQRGMSAHDIEELLYHQAGLLGMSGIASDMRTLLASPEKAAAEAVELFVFRIARETGALAASMGGIDGFVFTAGIGEHAAEIRAMVVERLGWLGARLDPAANGAARGRISTAESRLPVLVVPTDEEAMIAGEAFGVVQGK